jgi:hypothetical protein
MADASGAAGWGPLIIKSGVGMTPPGRRTTGFPQEPDFVATSPETDSLIRFRRNLYSFVPVLAGDNQNEIMFSTALSRFVLNIFSQAAVGNLCINQVSYEL